MKGKHLAMLVSCLTVLSSCASIKKEARYPVRVTNTAVFDLLPPSDMAGAASGLYSIAMKAGDKSFFAVAYLTADDTGLYATLMNDFGMDIANLIYKGEELILTSEILPQKITQRPQYLAADLQFALYNEDAICAALKEAGLAFALDGNKKTILKGKKKIEEIEVNKSADGNICESIKVNNILRGYTLEAVRLDEAE